MVIELIRSIFLQALPSEITVHLVGEELPLDRMAMKADAVHLQLTKTNFNPFPESSRRSCELMHAGEDRAYHNRAFPAANNRPSTAFNPDDIPGLCWYHRKFGPVQAKKCHGKPCPMFPCLKVSKNE